MTRVTSLDCGLLLLLCWASGCRSERVVFQFQPGPTQAVVLAPYTIAAQTLGDTAQPATHLLPGTPVATHPMPQHGHRRKPRSRETNAARRTQLRPRLALQTHSSAGSAFKPRRTIDDPPWGSIMFLLGGAMCVAAVLVGLNMGGWLGLGVGTLVYLAGAYLIAWGFAGPNKSASTGLSSRPTRH